MKFIVSKELFDKVPNAVFGVIIAKNIDNSKEYPFIENMLDKEINNISIKYGETKAKEIDKIMLYRDAFRALDINPNKYMCSIEALISRTLKQKSVSYINPLVDLGNALSIKYVVPLGIHDIDKITGDIEIRKANELDKFIPFGSCEVETPDKGEMIYVSNNDVRTRRWTWRQGENGKVDETIKNAFIPMDAFLENKSDMLALQEEFKSILESMGIEILTGIVDKDNNVFEW